MAALLEAPAPVRGPSIRAVWLLSPHRTLLLLTFALILTSYFLFLQKVTSSAYRPWPTALRACCPQRATEQPSARGVLSPRRLRGVALNERSSSHAKSYATCSLNEFGITKHCRDCEIFHLQMCEDGLNLTVRCGWQPMGSVMLPPPEIACSLFCVGSRKSCETCFDFHRRLLNGPLQFNLTNECGWQIAGSTADECEQQARRDDSDAAGAGEREQACASSKSPTANTPSQCTQSTEWPLPTVAGVAVCTFVFLLCYSIILRKLKRNWLCIFCGRVSSTSSHSCEPKTLLPTSSNS